MRVFIAFFIAMAFLGSCHAAQASQKTIINTETTINVPIAGYNSPVEFTPVQVEFKDGVIMDCVIGGFYRDQLSCVRGK